MTIELLPAIRRAPAPSIAFFAAPALVFAVGFSMIPAFLQAAVVGLALVIGLVTAAAARKAKPAAPAAPAPVAPLAARPLFTPQRDMIHAIR